MVDANLALPDETVVGNWKIGSELGRGGQGVVWSVRPTTTRRSPPRALKACFSAETTERSRFVREIELLRRCQSPNILQVVDSDPTWIERVSNVPAFAFYVSERCDGSLEEKKRKLGDAGARLALFREACDAVRYLHELDEPLIHRDIKPSNFLLALEPRRLVLADFGIARPLDSGDNLTQIQEVVGTQHFRAPEVTAGQPPTLRSDIYSLGRVLEWLLTGDVSTDLGTRPIPRGDKLSDGACVALDVVIVKACHPVSGNRFGSVRELMSSLPGLWLDVKPRAETAASAPSPMTDKTAFARARDIARVDDRAAWREAEVELKRAFGEAMRQWRSDHQAPPFANDQASFIAFADSLFSNVMPRLSFALAGVVSQKLPYSDQRRTIEQILGVPDWNWAGFEVPLNAPYAVGFLFQYLHGALCCELGRFDLALQMASFEVASRDGRSEPSPLWRNHQLVGWPQTLGGDFRHASASLRGAYDRFEIVRDFFSDQAEFQISFASYSILLSLIELASDVQSIGALTKEQMQQGLMIDVPPLFLGLDLERIGTAAHRILGNRDVIEMVATNAKTSRSALATAWPKWKAIVTRALGGRFAGDLNLGDLRA